MSADWQDRRTTLITTSEKLLPALRAQIDQAISVLPADLVLDEDEFEDESCSSREDLILEFELLEQDVRCGLSLINHLIASARTSNVTPAKIEEWRGAFRHFDKDGTDVRNLRNICRPELIADPCPAGNATPLWPA